MQQQRGFQRNGLFRGNRRNSRLKQVLLPGTVVQQPLASQQNQQAAVKPEQTVPVLPKVVDSVPPVEEISLVKTDIPEEMTIVQPTETVVKA